MLTIFNKPYPFDDDLKHNAKIIFFISLGVFVLFWLFEPIGLAEMTNKSKFILISGFTFITFLSLSLNLLFIPSLFPKQFTSVIWNVKREIFWNLWILSTILVGNFIYAKVFLTLEYNFYMVIKVVLTSVFPITILIIINHNKMLRSHLKKADELNKKLKENKAAEEKIIFFDSDYQKDSLAIQLSSLMIVKSASNYIEVFWKEAEIIRNQMVRCSMQHAEEILKDHKFIFKCHRSFMVNINFIERFEGNSQGYKLFFDHIPFSIPVARSFVSRLQELI